MIAGLAAAGAAFWLYERSPVFVETATVVSGDVPLIVSAQGAVVERRNTEISAGTMGRVERILVHEGDLVSRGQVLVRLDPVAFRSQVESAEAALGRAVAESENANAALERAREKSARAGALEGEKMASDDYRQAAKADESSAESARDLAFHSVAEARARVEAARGELLRAQVIAPVAGRVAAVRARVGETVADGHGPVLLSIAEPGAWDAEVFPVGAAVAAVVRGQAAAVRIGGASGRPMTGAVSKIETDSGGRLAVRIELRPAGDSLSAGLAAAAAIETPGRTNVPVVPSRCLVGTDRAGADESRASVFVLERGEAKRRPVSVGLRAAGRAEITAGLRAGESIVAGPKAVLRRLKDGDRVSPASGGSSKWL